METPAFWRGLPDRPATLTLFNRCQRGGLSYAAERARYSREARYEVSGYNTVASCHQLRAAHDSAKTNRRAPPSDPAAAYGAFRRVCRTCTKTPTFIADAAAKAPWSELMRGVIETLYGTDDWGAKVLDMLTTSFTASTYSNDYEGKFRLFAEFRIDEEDVFPPDYTEATVSATSHAPRSAAPSVPALCNPTMPSTSSYVTPVGMTPWPPA
eukprot:jgi/Tetstr1/432011/TSEL_021487.t1